MLAKLLQKRIIFAAMIAGAPVRLVAQDISELLRRIAAGEITHISEADSVAPELGELHAMETSKIDPLLQDIGTASLSKDVNIRRLCAMALVMISARRDATSLLSEAEPALHRLLIDQDEPTERLAAISVSNFRPSASMKLTDDLMEVLSNRLATTEVRSGIAGILLQVAPNRRDAVEAVITHIQRKDLSSAERTQLLQDIIVSRNKDSRVALALGPYLSDPSEETVRKSLETLQVMGESALAINHDNIAKVAIDPNRSAETRQAAQTAIQQAR